MKLNKKIISSVLISVVVSSNLLAAEPIKNKVILETSPDDLISNDILRSEVMNKLSYENEIKNLKLTKKENELKEKELLVKERNLKLKEKQIELAEKETDFKMLKNKHEKLKEKQSIDFLKKYPYTSLDFVPKKTDLYLKELNGDMEILKDDNIQKFKLNNDDDDNKTNIAMSKYDQIKIKNLNEQIKNYKKLIKNLNNENKFKVINLLNLNEDSTISQIRANLIKRLSILVNNKYRILDKYKKIEKRKKIEEQRKEKQKQRELEKEREFQLKMAKIQSEANRKQQLEKMKEEQKVNKYKMKYNLMNDLKILSYINNEIEVEYKGQKDYLTLNSEVNGFKFVNWDENSKTATIETPFGIITKRLEAQDSINIYKNLEKVISKNEEDITKNTDNNNSNYTQKQNNDLAKKQNSGLGM